MKTNIIKNSTGFSLLEIIVSMLILSVAIAGNLALVNSSCKLLDQAKAKLKAANTAAGILEQARNNVRSDIELSDAEDASYQVTKVTSSSCTEVRAKVTVASTCAM